MEIKKQKSLLIKLKLDQLSYYYLSLRDLRNVKQ